MSKNNISIIILLFSCLLWLAVIGFNTSNMNKNLNTIISQNDILIRTQIVESCDTINYYDKVLVAENASKKLTIKELVIQSGGLINENKIAIIHLYELEALCKAYHEQEQK